MYKGPLNLVGYPLFRPSVDRYDICKGMSRYNIESCPSAIKLCLGRGRHALWGSRVGVVEGGGIHKTRHLAFFLIKLFRVVEHRALIGVTVIRNRSLVEEIT